MFKEINFLMRLIFWIFIPPMLICILPAYYLGLDLWGSFLMIPTLIVVFKKTKDTIEDFKNLN